METKTGTGDTASNIFLTGSIFLANLDFAGLMDYALKAVIGGFMWLLFKMVADHIERKRNERPGKKTVPKKRTTTGRFAPEKEPL
jgi:hypothetical protein